MTYPILRKTAIAAALVSATLVATSASAHGGYGGMMGPGMMGGYGPGSGYGPGYGMAYGMMGGMMGHGMMGHGMMGHGMMGHGMMGHGMMGPGMMGNGMIDGTMGPGMMGGMGYGTLAQINLSPEQWKKVTVVHEDIAKKQWVLMGTMREEAFKLRSLMAAEKRDRDEITRQFKQVQDIRLQMFQARLEGHERLSGILTAEQQAQLRRFAPWWGQGVD